MDCFSLSDTLLERHSPISPSLWAPGGCRSLTWVSGFLLLLVRACAPSTPWWIGLGRWIQRGFSPGMKDNVSGPSPSFTPPIPPNEAPATIGVGHFGLRKVRCGRFSAGSGTRTWLNITAAAMMISFRRNSLIYRRRPGLHRRHHLSRLDTILPAAGPFPEEHLYLAAYTISIPGTAHPRGV